jgi:hypothetical protein
MVTKLLRNIAVYLGITFTLWGQSVLSSEKSENTPEFHAKQMKFLSKLHICVSRNDVRAVENLMSYFRNMRRNLSPRTQKVLCSPDTKQ